LISFIKGTVAFIGENYIVVETMGIGYRIFTTKTDLAHAKKETELKLFTYMSVKEDSVTLYGFTQKEELEMFEMLTSVPGVGPKSAVSVLESLTPKQITMAVLTDDYASLSKAQGIGKKTAQLMALRLKDKFGAASSASAPIDTPEAADAKRDATEALVALGYGRSEALKAVLETAIGDMNTQQIIRAALRKISK
jgi:Holliday junction DNA helicase RuvA